MESFEKLKHRRDEDLPPLPEPLQRQHIDVIEVHEPILTHVDEKSKEVVEVKKTEITETDIKKKLHEPTHPSSDDFDLAASLRAQGYRFN